MKIGQLVKTYVRKAFRYCDESDHEELARLMDAKYSKDTLGINFPFCVEVEAINSLFPDDAITTHGSTLNDDPV